MAHDGEEAVGHGGVRQPQVQVHGPEPQLPLLPVEHKVHGHVPHEAALAAGVPDGVHGVPEGAVRGGRLGEQGPEHHVGGRHDLVGGRRRRGCGTEGEDSRRLEEVNKAVGGGYCPLQMPLKPALGVRGTVAGHRLGALEGGGGGYLPPLRGVGMGRGVLEGLLETSCVLWDRVATGDAWPHRATAIHAPKKWIPPERSPPKFITPLGVMRIWPKSVPASAMYKLPGLAPDEFCDPHCVLAQGCL